MEVEKSILKRPNQKTDQSIAGRTVHFRPQQKVQNIQEKLAEHECPTSQAIPLDVYGKPEVYRWRTAYDEAYNVEHRWWNE